MAKPKNNIKRDFIVPLLGIIGCLYQIFFSWLIVYAIVVIFATCFNMAHSKLIATIIWLFLPLLIRVYRLLRNKVIGESWEELCDKEYCAKCHYLLEIHCIRTILEILCAFFLLSNQTHIPYHQLSRHILQIN